MEPQLPPDPARPAAQDAAIVSAAPVAAASASAAAAYKDRSTGLIIYGIVEIALGGMAALAIPFMLLSAVFARKIPGGAMPAGTYVSGICSYSFAAAALVTLGIGSIRARRWARALNLILSWFWLTVGIVATAAMTAFMPSIFAAAFRKAAEQNPNAPSMPTGVAAVILTVVIVFFSIFLVLLPFAFLLFFRRKDVEETCKRRDPVERWTDRCPLPVLAMSLLFGCGAVYYLLLAVTTPLMPFFGRYLTGLVGAAALVVVAAIDGFLAVSLYRLRLAGWWTAMGVQTLRMISAAFTFRHADLLQVYSKMGWSDTQLQQMSANPVLRNGSGMLWWTLPFMLLFLGYLIWIKRYFGAPGEPAAAEPRTPYLSSPTGPAL
ncbi:MAG TPA: hypothetical protein VKR60_04045 [Candidatus Sulfotelmatobacter sp.]|nr:hypothetical protein [Candidatus Sulfotelmatobacter sp.]